MTWSGRWWPKRRGGQASGGWNEPVGAAQLRLFDELFSFDCEGVSSIASCEGTPYLSLTAERIAAALAALPER